jgi:sugar (pentulose or hexulose) kinase
VLSDTYEPDSRRHQAYRQRFELYRELYPAIAPIAHGLA